MRSITAAVVLLAATTLVRAATPSTPQQDARHVRSLAATCASCHAVAADRAGGASALNGRARADLERTMQEFAAGKRAGTVMPQLAKGYTDAQIAAIAAWYAAQEPEHR